MHILKHKDKQVNKDEVKLMRVGQIITVGKEQRQCEVTSDA